ncbi:hypothetical protein DOS74_07690 [Staphylococcus felis]|uniref:Uncharacterized protein n=1 Tax=Staphylococcus felis TaxID=46127 RepID=A0AAX1RZ83_9STAP|nr:hypothetical protein [Staphylococcus felis]REH74773.1 hypothetical protein DOS59_11175 [Staphylococcus felis]REH83232.1 hypothetical protein DOS63_08865 [Staphylococcus felis]REH98915.1 hypothetical protein DOS64_10425 [Staphylococcus felis]REI15018.1 hypothetical protein DOS75_10310 [Staphylococcus felis]REI15051.1 hypothetical protein DOS74_07690 [Staphylococcus felis]
MKTIILNVFNGEEFKDQEAIDHSRLELGKSITWLFWGMLLILNVSIWIKLIFGQTFIIESIGIILFMSVSLTVMLKTRAFMKKTYPIILMIINLFCMIGSLLAKYTFNMQMMSAMDIQDTIGVVFCVLSPIMVLMNLLLKYK